MAAPEDPSARVPARRQPPQPKTIVVAIKAPIARADIAPLSECLRALLEVTRAHLVICDVDALVDPDAVTVDVLARLQLTARRLGRQVRLRHAPRELQELLALSGLSDVLPTCVRLPLESSRETEEREQARGVEEERDPDDLTR